MRGPQGGAAGPPREAAPGPRRRLFRHHISSHITSVLGGSWAPCFLSPAPGPVPPPRHWAGRQSRFSPVCQAYSSMTFRFGPFCGSGAGLGQRPGLRFSSSVLQHGAQDPSGPVTVLLVQHSCVSKVVPMLPK